MRGAFCFAIEYYDNDRPRFHIERGRFAACRYQTVIAASDRFARYDFAALFAPSHRADPAAIALFATGVTLKIGHESHRAANDLRGKRRGDFENSRATGVSGRRRLRKNLHGRAARPEIFGAANPYESSTRWSRRRANRDATHATILR
jgi:hypothetical protein